MIQSSQEGPGIPSDIKAVLEAVGSTALLKAATKIPPALWSLSFAELEKLASPSKTAVDLRNSFWRAFNQNAGERAKIQLTDLAAAARCTYTHAYELITKKPAVLAWILYPPPDSSGDGPELLMTAFGRLRSVLELPLFGPDGKVIAKNANLSLQAFKLLYELHAGKERGSKF